MQPLWVVTAVSMGLVSGMATDQRRARRSSSPTARPPCGRRSRPRPRGRRSRPSTRRRREDETVYWAEVAIGGKTYAIGVLEDGTLTEMNLAVDDAEVPFDRCPAAVQATFRREAFGEKVEGVGKDMKYGVTIYETVVQHKGKSYEIVVAEDGTLVEKVLVIEDEEVELAKCPAAVQAALREHARGGTIGDITRSTGIGRPTFEAEVEIKDKVYLIEVAENGLLISKSLEAGEE